MTPHDSHRKPKKPKRRKQQRSSKTGVYSVGGKVRGEYTGLWGNARVPFTVRVDEEIKRRFTDFCQRVFGSVCLPVEVIMAGVLGSVVEVEKHGVFPGSNVPLKFDVGKIVIERNLRTRRKMVVEEEVETVTYAERVADEKVSQLDKVLGMVRDQWPLHPSLEWRRKWKEKAREHPELPNAAFVLGLASTVEWPV